MLVLEEPTAFRRPSAVDVMPASQLTRDGQFAVVVSKKTRIGCDAERRLGACCGELRLRYGGRVCRGIAQALKRQDPLSARNVASVAHSDCAQRSCGGPVLRSDGKACSNARERL